MKAKIIYSEGHSWKKGVTAWLIEMASPTSYLAPPSEDNEFMYILVLKIRGNEPDKIFYQKRLVLECYKSHLAIRQAITEIDQLKSKLFPEVEDGN